MTVLYLYVHFLVVIYVVVVLFLGSLPNYCKTLDVSMRFISRAKQNREIKGREYQLQAKIGRNYYSILNCMGLIRQNKRGQNKFVC